MYTCRTMYMHFADVTIHVYALGMPVSPPYHYDEAWLQVLSNSTQLYRYTDAFQRCINFFTKQTCFSSLTLSADPVMTSDPSSDMSTAKMAALCPVSVVSRRQREMSHTLACTEIKIRLKCRGG